MFLKIVSIFLVVVLAKDCNSHKHGNSLATSTTANFPAGWILYDIPNTGDTAGRVFRETSTGQRFFVTDLTVPVKQDNVILRDYSGNRTTSLNVIVGFLGLKHFNLTASDSVLHNTTVNYSLKIGLGERQYTGDLDVDKALADVTPTIKRDKEQAGRDHDKYYVIREIITSNNYEFSFDKGILTNQSFKAAFSNLANANQGYSLNTGDSATLSFKNSNLAYHILYVADEIQLRHGLTGDMAVRTGQANESDIEK
jgi:hypothetical protein